MTLKKKMGIALLCGLVLLSTGLICLFGGNMEEFESRVPEVERTQFLDNETLDKRNVRYGEIIPIYRKGAKLYIEVYNSGGFNNLPQEQWEQLDAKEMAEELGAMKVIINGPRYTVLNKGEPLNTQEKQNDKIKIASFNGIEMYQPAVLHSNIFSGTVGDKLYEENMVERSTKFTFLKDNMVYELISPEGDVYRMQSYTQMTDPSLTIDDLEFLGSKLDLPEGWSYNARILKEDSILIANGEAFVINDELGNSYQRITN